MKRKWFLTAAAGVVILVAALGQSAHAEINVNINVPLPGVVIAAPPALIIIPGTYAYFAPDVGVDIIFYQDFWYRPYGGGWYISAGYNGPWRLVPAVRVPRVLLSLPPDYRAVPPGHQRMPYGQVKKNWRTWEQERHWEKHGAKQEWKEERGHQKEKRGGKEKKKGKGKGKHGND